MYAITHFTLYIFNYFNIKEVFFLYINRDSIYESQYVNFVLALAGIKQRNIS